MRRSGSTSCTQTLPDALYISHSQVSSAPSSILPLLLVYQNVVVIDGSARASKTSCGGRRMSTPTSTDGVLASCVIGLFLPSGWQCQRQAVTLGAPLVQDLAG